MIIERYHSPVFAPKFKIRGVNSTTLFQVLQSDNTVVLNVDTTNARVGIGTDSPSSAFHIKAGTPGTIGSHPAGQLIVQNPTASVFANAVITGYSSDGDGNPNQQLWYLGNSSVGSSDITFLNRRNSKLTLGTSGTSRITILGSGNVGIGTAGPSQSLHINKGDTVQALITATTTSDSRAQLVLDGQATNGRGELTIQGLHSGFDGTQNDDGPAIFRMIGDSGGGNPTSFAWTVAASTKMLKLDVVNDGSGDSTTGMLRLTSGGIVSIGETPPTNADKLSIGGGWTFKETTVPTADDGYGKIWTDANNELWFQSGAGANHLLHGDAFSNIWFHSPNTVAVSISTQDAFTKIDSFTVVGNEDDLGIVTGSTSTNDLTLSAIGGGEYEISYHGSITATGGADKDMMVALGITLATPKDITDVTDDTITPIVITSTAHGLKEGDMVEIVGVLGNTAANGSFIVDNETANTFEITSLDGSATTGNGDFDAGSPTGDVTIEYPGNMVVHRTVRGADPGAISATGLHILANSDVLALYVANLVGTTNLTVLAVSLDTVRIGD